MARLIHLNGPPGVGKSTVARLYAADPPGTLAVDVDLVVSMIGGWRENFWQTLPVGRRLAALMAQEHLASGQDVLLPQLVTSKCEIEPYLAAVQNAGATYSEIVLFADLHTTVARFVERPMGEVDSIDRHLTDVVREGGGDHLLRKIRGDLTDYLAEAENYVAVDTTGQTIAETYDRVRAAMES
jgi:AAA domain